MKFKLFTIFFSFILISCTAQNKSTQKTKNLFGIATNAPIETYQYAFKLGLFKTEYRILISKGNYKTSVGKTYVKMGKNGLTYMEDNIDNKGNKTGWSTFTYNSKKGIWENLYFEKDKKPTSFYAKYDNGYLTEFVEGKDQYGSYTEKYVYKIINDSTYTYQGKRKYPGIKEFEVFFTKNTLLKR
ncbi:MAG: hypothetical protein HWD85_05415 [Flavobacteriaceae bacterium]|nr:hypothetical protein [Flavobacteriaceae bacterium]